MVGKESSVFSDRRTVYKRRMKGKGERRVLFHLSEKDNIRLGLGDWEGIYVFFCMTFCLFLL